MNKYSYIVLAFLTILFVHCAKTPSSERTAQEDKNSDLPLFTIIPPNQTRLNFVNLINESPSVNGILYEYLYNGGGVAAGDFDNNGLQDLYFISNLYSNKLFLNKGNLIFEDVTTEAGVKGKAGFPTGVTTVDINYDGLLDIYISKSGNYPNPEYRRNELYLNKGLSPEGIPIFEEVAKSYGLDLAHYSTQAAFFDYDKDGDLDMFLLNHNIDPAATESNIDRLLTKKSEFSSNRLYRNDNDYFTDVSQESGIINNAIGFGLGIAIGDLNNDLWPDLVVGMDYSEKDHIYINQKDGTFKEVIEEATNHISNFSMGNDIGDINNDGLFDFISVDMVSNNNYDLKTNMGGMNPKRFQNLIDNGLHHQYMYNTLQLNNGNMLHNGKVPAFSNVAQITGLARTNWSWAPLFFDMDNDGLQDVFVSNGVLRSFRNNDFVNYKRERVATLYEDLKLFRNRDSLIENYYKDVLAIMPEKKEVNLFFKNNGNFSFSEIRNPEDPPSATNGAIYVDLDNDGDLDLVGNNINDAAFVYRNNTIEKGSGENYLKINFKGIKGNSHGIGAKVIVESGATRQFKELYVSRGFQSAVASELHFGLGTDNCIEKLTVIWPDGKTQILKEPKTNQRLTLYQEESSEVALVPENRSPPIFDNVYGLPNELFKHVENYYDDYEKEILLPHKYSQNGPALAVGDVNNDGLDDFFVGGAKYQAGVLFLQKPDGSFGKSGRLPWDQDKDQEDVAAEFIDADGDGDLDLYVVSGGNEAPEDDDYYVHRFYENLGNGVFVKTSNAIPNIRVSGSCVKKADFDNDGDMDLFIGGKLVPGKYPFPANSYILKNESEQGKISFIDATEEIAPSLTKLGMVSDAEWIDLDNDDDLDLVILGEWMPIKIMENRNGIFTELTEKTGLEGTAGWWFGINGADFDKDGDTDFIAGNLGKNYKYKASQEEPFEVFADDFDENGSLDIVLSYHEKGKIYPLRGRQCSSDQMPFIKKKFPSYGEFGSADLSKVYGPEALKKALHYEADTFASVYVENLGNFKFKVHELPQIAQFSSINSIVIDDFDSDGNADALVSGNLYQSEVETPRNDASYGTVLLGNGKGQFKPLYPYESGLFVKGDVKHACILRNNTTGRKQIVFAKNDDEVQLINYGPRQKTKIE